MMCCRIYFRHALAYAADWDSAAAEAVAASVSDAATSGAAVESDSADLPNAVYPLEFRSGYCSYYNKHFAWTIVFVIRL